MQIEIRDITPEEAAPYGENADIVLTGRKTVVFTDADGNVGKLYMKEEDIDLLGKQYIAENSTLEYSKVCGEWFPKVSWNAYKNDPQRNPPKTIDVEFVCGMEGECTEIWRRLDTGGYLMRQLCREPFARWLTCRKLQGRWLDLSVPRRSWLCHLILFNEAFHFLQSAGAVAHSVEDGLGAVATYGLQRINVNALAARKRLVLGQPAEREVFSRYGVADVPNRIAKRHGVHDLVCVLGGRPTPLRDVPTVLGERRFILVHLLPPPAHFP